MQIGEAKLPMILMYHRVEDDYSDPFGIQISPTNFREHMEFLRLHYRILSLSALVNHLRSGSSLERTACITFDDGYESVFSVAKPILEALAIPATVFLTAHFQSGKAFWWDRLVAILECSRAPPGRILPGDPELVMKWEELRKLGAQAREVAVDELQRSLGLDGIGSCSMPMSASQAKQLPTSLIAVGAHTLTHPNLAESTRSEAENEIHGSKALLERFFARPIDYFCYPFGQLNEDARGITIAAGFKAALAVGQQFLSSGSDLFAIPRIDPGAGTVHELRARLEKIKLPVEPAASITSIDTNDQPAAAIEPSDKAGVAETRVDAYEKVDYGQLRRTEPISRGYGFGRGVPIDRYYIEAFLGRHRYDIWGRVLEIKDRTYSTQFSLAGVDCDVLDIDPSNAAANIIADLQSASSLPDSTYDCIILTQVLQFIYDLRAALRTLHRILKPGGILLVTAPGISATPDQDGPWFWSFHEASLRRLLAERFDEKKLLVESHGNVLAAVSFLEGLAQEDLPGGCLPVEDTEYPVVLVARAVKAALPPDLDVLAMPPLVHTPKVSVIIPVFNAERTIAEAIESLLLQSVTDWELIVVDDGSTDASRNRARIYAERFPDRIFIETHPDAGNHGLSRTRNRGLLRARGALLCFLDADDTWLPHKLDHDISILERHPQAAGVVGPALWWWDDDSGRQAHVDRILEPRNRLCRPPEFCLETYVSHAGEPPCPNSWMIRKSALPAGGFDPEAMTYEDQKFIAELSFRFPIYLSGCCLAEYRRSDETLWPKAERDGSGAVARERFERWLADFVDS